MLLRCLRLYLAVILLHFSEIATRVQPVTNKPGIRTYRLANNRRYKTVKCSETAPRTARFNNFIIVSRGRFICKVL